MQRLIFHPSAPISPKQERTTLRPTLCPTSCSCRGLSVVPDPAPNLLHPTKPW